MRVSRQTESGNAAMNSLDEKGALYYTALQLATETRTAIIRSLLLPLSFFLQSVCNTELYHLMGDLLLHGVAISTCPRSASSASRGFSARVQIYGKAQAAALRLGKICRRKKQSWNAIEKLGHGLSLC